MVSPEKLPDDLPSSELWTKLTLEEQEFWSGLSEDEQFALQLLSKNPRTLGSGLNYLTDLIGYSQEEIDDLVNIGILEARPAWEMAKEFLDDNAEYKAKLEEKVRTNRLSPEESIFTSNYFIIKGVFERHNTELRYRIHSAQLHVFIAATLAESD